MSAQNGWPREALTHSETFGELMAALVKVQEDVGSVKKTEENPHFHHKYADLNAFLHALREPLSKHGIGMTQAPGVDGQNVTVDTLLYHTSGEWLRNRAASPMPKSDPQGVGSAITYLRRYSLAALFAVPQEDDDGNRASKRGDGGRRQAQDTEDSGYACPECGATNMWDNRADKAAGKRSKKFPDFKCRECDHPIWGSHPDDDNEASEELISRVKGLLDVAGMQDLVNVEQATRVHEALESGEKDRIEGARSWLKDIVKNEGEEPEPEEEPEEQEALL